MKVQQSLQLINPFGGIQFVLKQIKDAGIDKYINEQLGSRGEAKTYSIADGLLSIHYSHLCGGSCIEDINTLGEHIGFHPDLSLTSADTALRIMTELKTEDIIVQNGEVTHQFNSHNKLNGFLQKLAVKTGSVIPTAKNTLDFDNVILENEKSDAATTYKMTTGYQPGLAAIGRQIVFIEGRGGNTPAAYKMDETLKQCFKGLKENGIHIEHFRSDSAAYQQSVVEQAENNATYFYIRIDDSQSLRDAIKDIPQTEWKPAIINNKKVEIADTPFFAFNGKKAYRAVVQRRKRKDQQFDIFSQSPYSYYAIMTNNETPEATNLYVTEFYNQRGDSERNFDILNNDFNCNRLPFSYLNANVVYLFAAAISFTLFEWVKQIFFKKGAIAKQVQKVPVRFYDTSR
jgi:predicted 3-demethylubiquinone-9 3-methyltransferase (glyoxalase superfamily)